MHIKNHNNTFIENAGDLGNVMPMYNLLEYSDNYSMTSRSFSKCHRDKVNDYASINSNASSYRINNNK